MEIDGLTEEEWEKAIERGHIAIDKLCKEIMEEIRKKNDNDIYQSLTYGSSTSFIFDDDKE